MKLWDRIVLPFYLAHYYWYVGMPDLYEWAKAEYEKASRELEEARAKKK